MVQISKRDLLGFSLGILIMVNICFGFVPLINLFEVYFNVMALILFWAPFGVSCLVFGFIIDKIKNENKKFLCFSFMIWGALVISLIYSLSNLFLTLSIIILIGIFTAPTVLTAIGYMNSNLDVNKRALNVGIYLAISWAIVSVTAYVSFINWFLNIIILAILNISIGIISFSLIQISGVELKWEQETHIPRDYDIKKNSAIYWGSSVVFGAFLGIIVFLLGTTGRITQSMSSFYLENVRFYVEVVRLFNLGLTNFDFLVIGALNIFLSIIYGKLIDKYGRKRMFLIVNFMIPAVMICFGFWGNIVFLGLSVFFYASITAGYCVIIGSVYCDMAPEGKLGQYNGLGWSALGIGGSLGFIIAFIMTDPLLISMIDMIIIIVIISLSEVSLIPYISMKESLPPAEEMEWAKDLIHLYVIKDNGVLMSDYSFVEKELVDHDLFSGGISGITTILQEMVDSQQKLKVIDHEDKKLLFEYGEQFSIILVAKKDLKILRTKLKKLTEQIQTVFWETIASWDGDLELFKPIKTLIRNYFVEK
ncbi:MAG: MFS transporter [Candidatus Lokiarchaeota archaeon]|nr:MFS transporter [Candidatus Lokiarchaeota archaeon]